MAGTKKDGEKGVRVVKAEVISVPALKQEFTELSQVDTNYSEKQLDFVKTTLAPTLDNNELRLFIYRSQELGLNPLNGEIFAYSSFETVAGTKQRKLVMIVARDGKRKIAFRSGHLKSVSTEAIYVKKQHTMQATGKAEGAGAEEAEIVVRVEPWAGGTLWGAACTIVRDDFEVAFTVMVPLSEYKRKSYIWEHKPGTMIKKVAESQCLSAAFPELAGVYDEAERGDGGETKAAPQVKGGSQRATEAQLKTITAMGGAVSGVMTKQEAVDLIVELNSKKGKK